MADTAESAIVPVPVVPVVNVQESIIDLHPIDILPPIEKAEREGYLWASYEEEGIKHFVSAFGVAVYAPALKTWTLVPNAEWEVYRYSRGVPECGVKPRLFQLLINHRVTFNGEILVTARPEIDVTGLVLESATQEFLSVAAMMRESERNGVAGITSEVATAVATIAASTLTSSSSSSSASASAALATLSKVANSNGDGENKTVAVKTSSKKAKSVMEGTMKCVVFAVGSDHEYWITPKNGNAIWLKEFSLSVARMLGTSSPLTPPTWWAARLQKLNDAAAETIQRQEARDAAAAAADKDKTLKRAGNGEAFSALTKKARSG